MALAIVIDVWLATAVTTSLKAVPSVLLPVIVIPIAIVPSVGSSMVTVVVLTDVSIVVEACCDVL